jgi:hypothetical protein
MYTLL